MSSKALAFKQEGNQKVAEGDYKAAEALYSQAIVHDSLNPVLFTNRAITRLKLLSYNAALSDCLQAIDLNPASMKAYYYLSLSQLALHHPNEALSSALTAYELCLATGAVGDTSSISALVLRAKKEKWEVREKERLRGRSELLAELEERLDIAKKVELDGIAERLETGEMDAVQAKEDLGLLEEISRRKVDELRSVFAVADPENMAKREVPEYIVDNISFAIMHDPVMTKTGHSYDRATLLEHLRRSPTDPLTREPLRKEDLRPNLALKQACAAFLEENGWAVDW